LLNLFTCVHFTVSILTQQALENDLVAHEATVLAVNKDAKELISMGHFASHKIHDRNTALQSAWRELKNLASNRKQKLVDALEAQKVHSTYVLWHLNICFVN